MKNKLLLTLYALLIAGSFGFMGCDDDEKSGSTGAPAAETVTLADLTSDTDVTVPTGSGTAPATKETAGELAGRLMDTSDNITSAIEDIVMPEAKTIAKNFKNTVVSALVKSKAPVTDDGTDTWDTGDTIDASTIEDDGDYPFLSGTIEWTSKGTSTWSDTYDDETGAFSFSENGNGSYNVELVDLVPGGGEATVDGFINENFVVNMSVSGSYSETAMTSLTQNGSMSFSHRSGYGISGDTYTCYVVISSDLTGSVNISLNETQLAGLTEDEAWDLADEAFNISGSMTVTVYNAAGTQVLQQVFTAEEVMAMDEDEAEEPAAEK